MPLLVLVLTSLSLIEHRHLTGRRPLTVGNLNGAPARLRCHADRAALAGPRERDGHRASDVRLTAAGQDTAGRRMQRLDSLPALGREIPAFDPTEQFAEVSVGTDHTVTCTPGDQPAG